jgi:hypothetical protein
VVPVALPLVRAVGPSCGLDAGAFPSPVPRRGDVLDAGVDAVRVLPFALERTVFKVGEN